MVNLKKNIIIKGIEIIFDTLQGKEMYVMITLERLLKEQCRPSCL